jgi:hypothetical protein
MADTSPRIFKQTATVDFRADKPRGLPTRVSQKLPGKGRVGQSSRARPNPRRKIGARRRRGGARISERVADEFNARARAPLQDRLRESAGDLTMSSVFDQCLFRKQVEVYQFPL